MIFLGKRTNENLNVISFIKCTYGLNTNTAKFIIENSGIKINSKANTIPKFLFRKMENFIKNNYLIERLLKLKINNSIDERKKEASYRGYRLRQFLPVHGQRTHSNSQTQARAHRLKIKVIVKQKKSLKKK